MNAHLSPCATWLARDGASSLASGNVMDGVVLRSMTGCRAKSDGVRLEVTEQQLSGQDEVCGFCYEWA